ncbi:adenosine receptor A1-like [Orbicella faveolata]|uniref:adenosine receptor A1-like n=1 Tax=Orbicella faveolata TaxID=48498 RepID=UPI0009E44C6A|nr:adenosine receptor A1-like [Orbicella faveolata]
MAATESPYFSTYVVNCAINAFSSYTAIMLNILTIHAMRKTLSLPKPLKALLLSLAVSDLAVGLVAQPFNIGIMVVLLKNTLPPSSTGKLYSFFTNIFSWTSFFGVVAISVDRLLAIQLHLRYQALVTHKRVVAVVISIWVFSIILSSILTFRFIPINEITSVVLAVTMGLCFICTAIIYCKIYITVRRHTNQINVLQVPQQETRNGERANAARQRKSAVVYCWKMRNIRRAVMNTIRSIFSKPQGNDATLNSDIEGWSNSVRLTVHSRRDTHF